MPGYRDRNLRSGHIKEDFGTLLLRQLALVAPVPLPEDFGLDVVATLIRPEGGRGLIPEDTFGVQFKASSEKDVAYTTPEAVTWLMNLGVPFFVGSVRLDEGVLDLYTTNQLFRVHLHPKLREVHLCIDADTPESFGTPEIARVQIGPPILSWTLAKSTDLAYLNLAYRVLKAHIGCLQRCIHTRRMGRVEVLRWQTNELPTVRGSESYLGSTGNEISEAMELLRAPIQTLLCGRVKPDLLPGVFQFIQVIRSLGVDLDPENLGMMGSLVHRNVDEELRRVYGRLIRMGCARMIISSDNGILEPLYDSETTADSIVE